MTQTAAQSARCSPTGFAGFERAFQATTKHRTEHRVAPLIAQWEVLLSFFKHGIEIPRILNVPGAIGVDEHRTVLTGLLAMGETIWLQVKNVEDEKLSQTGYEKAFIQANLDYLRDKYLDWYSWKDEEQIKADSEVLTRADAKKTGKDRTN